MPVGEVEGGVAELDSGPRRRQLLGDGRHAADELLGGRGGVHTAGDVGNGHDRDANRAIAELDVAPVSNGQKGWSQAVPKPPTVAGTLAGAEAVGAAEGVPVATASVGVAGAVGVGDAVGVAGAVEVAGDALGGEVAAAGDPPQPASAAMISATIPAWRMGPLMCMA